MITFGTDVADLILQRTLYDNTVGLNSSIERMTSGYKVNHAKDNAANFSIITDLNTQISSMLQVQQNAEDGLSMLQTAEGGLAEIEELLQRLRSLATQASNCNYGEQSREAMQAEADQIIEQIGQIRESMEYNGLNMYYTPREEEAVTTSIGKAAVSRLASAARVNSAPATQQNNTQNNLNNTTYIQNPACGGNTSAQASPYSTTKDMAPAAPSNAATASAPASTRSADTPSALFLIEGAESFNGGETRTITIDGIEYTITNRLVTANDLSYTKDTTTGEITFMGKSFHIRGQLNVEHNIIINGNYTRVYGGDLDDIITSNSGSGIEIRGGAGDDILTANAGVSTLLGEDGNDTLNIYSGVANSQGGNGDDIFNISYSSGSFYGNDGDDTFNLLHSYPNVTIDGGNGTNTVAGNIGTSTLINVVNANAWTVSLVKGVEQVVNINGIDYTMSTTTATAEVVYKVNDSGQIEFTGTSGAITIKGDENKSHNVRLVSGIAYFYGGNMGDVIEAQNGGVVYCGSGNNDISVYNAYIHCSSGNNQINASSHSRIYGGTGVNNVTLSGFYNMIINESGTMNVTVKGQNNTICGNGGKNTLVSNTGRNNFIYGFGDADNTDGFVFLEPLGSKTVTIDNKNYDFKNQNNRANVVLYSVNQVTNQIAFCGYSTTIYGQSDVSHNVNIYGAGLNFHGGDLDDTIEAFGQAGNLYGEGGNDTLINSGSSALHGGDGDDELILNKGCGAYGDAGNDTFYATGDNNTILGADGDDYFVVDGDNNAIDAGAGDNRITVEGSQNNISADDGNNTITINTDSNTINTGDGANRFVVNGSSNTVTAGSGANIIGVQGNNNNLTAQNASGTINIYGNENTITNTRGENDVVIRGDGNNYSTTVGDKNVTVTGDNNEILTGSGNDRLEIRGDGNTVESISGDNEFTVRGDGNTIQGGNGVDDISLNGNNNFANGGDTNDSFMISGGNNNTIDGNGGGRNTMINNGNNTQYSNVVDITPRPFDVNIKVDIGSGEDKFIHTQISFNLFDFSVDFTSQESALESLEDIDSLLNDVQEQLLNIGTTINRLETVIEAQGLKMNNLISTRSTLRDADVAEESSSFIRFQILQQASATLLSSSRSLKAQNVLGLIGRVNA